MVHLLDSSAFLPPKKEEIAKLLEITKAEFEEVFNSLLSNGEIIKINDELFLLEKTLNMGIEKIKSFIKSAELYTCRVFYAYTCNTNVKKIKEFKEMSRPKSDTKIKILRLTWAYFPWLMVMLFLILSGSTGIMLASKKERLDKEKKTVEEGGLWYEEALPTETILTGLAAVLPVKASSLTAADIFAHLSNLTEKALLLGGKTTVGRGLCRIQFAGINGGAS